MERGLRVVPACARRIAELADVAARTFPLACPPAVGPDDVAAFIAENLSAERFTEYLTDPDRAVLTAVEDDRILGYAMMIRGVPDDADVAAAVTALPTVEVSKMYVLPESHGAGAAAALMTAALQHARSLGAASVWLGVNQRNERAQRFYAKHGFTVAGTKRFRLGRHWEQDYVMVRPA
ncbi:GNAT family N-acetyltransferase [Mycobacterium sp. NAZ190054]|uniref:GNAT family N-acetyltransferase n=1 Tax=Mycobacterium sp. NAZ190054 TaxID=1747766 RepID=UPI0007916BC2|nr:GNAT family N-acetyltransferase [Mycobacterium sp. NAZ190054]KWX66534.1 acetyltransferase [Mycobacterium sp. NAZ190054]